MSFDNTENQTKTNKQTERLKTRKSKATVQKLVSLLGGDPKTEQLLQAPGPGSVKCY